MIARFVPHVIGAALLLLGAWHWACSEVPQSIPLVRWDRAAAAQVFFIPSRPAVGIAPAARRTRDDLREERERWHREAMEARRELVESLKRAP